MRLIVHALALYSFTSQVYSATFSSSLISSSSDVAASSLFTAVDPFRALGSDRFQCESCGYRIEAHSAGCKDVCFDDDPEDEGEIREEANSKDWLENDTDEQAISLDQQVDGESPPSSSPISSSSTTSLSTSSFSTDKPRQTSWSEATSSSLNLTPSIAPTKINSSSLPVSSSTATLSAERTALGVQLLSFEEWKSLQLSKQANRHSITHPPSPSASLPPLNDSRLLQTQNASDSLHREYTSSSAPHVLSTGLPYSSVLPTASSLDAHNSRIPVTPTSLSSSNTSAVTSPVHPAASSDSFKDISHTTKSISEAPSPSVSIRAPSRRFNYASLDCSARVHYSSPQTRSPAALLHKSKDRYMLTPCQASSYYVVIELCDEIRIDTLEIGNFEFFSSVVKDIQIRAGESEGNGREDAQGDIWKDLGTVRLANIRGMQSFKFDPPTSFHRYIRLDFLSHYGTEYYCPVSLLRVYGMNQMEAYRYEVHMQEKEQELLARWNKEDEEGHEVEAAPVIEHYAFPPEPVGIFIPKIGSHLKEGSGGKGMEHLKPTSTSLGDSTRRVEVVEETLKEEKISGLKARFGTGKKKKPQTSPKSAAEAEQSTLKVVSTVLPGSVQASHKQAVPVVSHTSSAQTVASASIPSLANSPLASTISLSPSSGSSTISTVNHSHAHQQPAYPSQSSPPRSSSKPPSSQSAVHHAPPSPSDSGESIYAFIIRRLTALEDNTSLATWYVDDQVRILREAWHGLEGRWETWKASFDSKERERWAGGLEGLRSQQEKMLKSTLRDWDRQRRDFDRDKTDLNRRLQALETEVRLHRKLLTASIVLMIIILACFFAVQIGSAEVMPAIDLVSKTSGRSKERNRRGKSEDFDHKYRRATSPIFRSNSIKRPTSPSPEDSSLDPTPRPSSPTYLYPNPRPRQKNSTYTPTRRPLSFASPTSSLLLPPLNHPVNSVSPIETHARNSVNSNTSRLRNTLHPSGSANSHYGFRKAARQAHLHTMTGGEKSGRAGKFDRPSSPATRIRKTNDQELTPRRVGSPALIVEDLQDTGVQTPEFYSSTPSLVVGVDGQSLVEDRWTPVSTDDETEELDGPIPQETHQTPPRSLSVPR